MDSPFKSGLFVSGYGRGPLALTLIGGVLLVCLYCYCARMGPTSPAICWWYYGARLCGNVV